MARIFGTYIPLAALYAAMAAPPSDGATFAVSTTVNARLTAKTAAGGDGTPIQVWTVDLEGIEKALGSTPITIDPQSAFEAGLRSAFVSELRTGLARLREIGHPWLPPKSAFFPDGPPESVPSDWLIENIIDVRVDGDEGSCDGSETLQPPEAGQAACWKLTFRADFAPIERIRIAITSNEPSPLLPGFEGPFQQVAARLGIAAREHDDRIHVTIRLADADLAAGRDKEEAITEACHVAAEIRDILETNRFGIGDPRGDSYTGDPVVDAVRDALTGPYTLADRNGDNATFLSLDPEFGVMPENELQVKVGVWFTHDVQIQGSDGAKPSAVDAVRKRYGERLNRLFKGRVARAQSLGRAIYELSIDEYVKKAAVTNAGGILRFVVDTRTVARNLAIDWGGGYLTHTGPYGLLGLAQENLPRQGDQLKEDASFGPHVAHVGLAGSVPERPHPYDGWRLQFLGSTLAGAFDFNNKVRFGDVVEDPTTFSEKSLSGSVQVGIDSFSVHDLLVWHDDAYSERKRARHVFSLTSAYDISLLHVSDKASGQVLTDGQVTAFSIRPAYVFERAGALWNARFAVAGDLAKCVRWLGSDFSYETMAPAGTVELTFGVHAPDEYLVRGRAGAGAASKGTPLPRLFQIGGPDFVRGLERGEYTANTLLWQQFEAGPSVDLVWSRIKALWSKAKRKSAQPSDTPGQGGPALPFDIKSSYVKAFFDRALVSHRTSIPSLTDAGISLHGIGAGLEIGRLNGRIDLTIGYGYSPQSRLHAHGVLFVGVNIR